MHRTVDTQRWVKEFRPLSRDAGLLCAYLDSSPHSHVSGLWYESAETISINVKIKPRHLDALWDDVSALVERDKEVGLVWVRDMLARYPGEKNARAAAEQVVAHWDSPLTARFLDQYPGVKRFVPKMLLHKVSDAPSLFESPPSSSNSMPPTLEEVRAYCVERGNNIDPQTFLDHYEAVGWRYGKGVGKPIKDWKAAVRTWEQRRREDSSAIKDPDAPQPGAKHYGVDTK